MSAILEKITSIKIFGGHRLTGYTLGRFGWSLVRGVIILGICFLIIYPTLVKFLVSLMPEQDLYDLSIKYIAKNPTLENYKTVIDAMQYPTAFWNTFKLSLATSIMQLISCTIVGYGFARFRFKGRGFLFTFVLITLIVPPQTIMIPLYLHFKDFDILGIFRLILGKPIRMLNSISPFVLMSMTCMGLKNGLYIYIIRQFFRGMPKELEEAAYVDGAGLFRTFYQIMLPGAVPAMLTVFLFSFVWQWTDSFYSALFLTGYKVLSNALTGVAHAIQLHLSNVMGTSIYISPVLSSMYINTASLLVILPVLLIYIVAQRYFVESIERTGIVG